MAFSKFLNSREDDCRQLALELSKHFKYAGVLGCDVESRSVRVNKKVASVSDGGDADRGFVIKLWDGAQIMEYSLSDVVGDKRLLAQKIIDAVKTFKPLETVSTAPLDDAPLEKSFERESDLDQYSDKQLLDSLTAIKNSLLAKSDKVVNAMALIRDMRVNKMFISKNRTLKQAYCWVNGILVVNYRDGEKMVSAREGACGHLMRDVLEELPKKVDALVKKAACLASAKPVEPGVYDVITDPSITGLLAHEAFGHGVEMDMFVKDRALAKYCVGEQVASKICNMRDGAASTLSVASYFFDDDGVLAGDTQIIKDGNLVSGISDLGSASQLGTSPTGNGRRESHLRKAYTRMTNTFFERGDDKLEDMIASIKHGYMIFETNNGMEDPKNWQIQCVAEYGREIVDGRLTDNYVAPVVMSGYVPDVLKSISMISDDFVVEGAGMCGKGHKEWVRVSDGGPALKLRIKLG